MQHYHGRSQDIGSGNNFGGGLVGCAGAGNFRKFFRNLRKLLKMHNLTYFQKGFNKPCVNFSRLLTKNTNYWETLKIYYENSIEN